MRTQVKEEINDFFLAHTGTQNKARLWDTFKEYNWGVFIGRAASFVRILGLGSMPLDQQVQLLSHEKFMRIFQNSFGMQCLAIQAEN